MPIKDRGYARKPARPRMHRDLAQQVYYKYRWLFSDLSEVEDEFDFAYLEDATVGEMAAWAEGRHWRLTYTLAYREALGRCMWCIDNQGRRSLKKRCYALAAREWSHAVATHLVRWAARELNKQ